MGGMAMPAPAQPVPPAPMPARGKSGGGKGLIIGLASLGVVLLGAMAVVAARSAKPDDEPTVIAPVGPAATGATGGPVAIEPTETAPTATETAPAPDTTPSPPEQPVATNTPKPSNTGSGKTSGTGTGTSTGTNTGTGTGTSSGTSTSKPSGGGACDSCESLARSGNIAGAAQAFNSCSDAAAKDRCKRAIRGPASEAIRTAARNGNCSQADTLLRAARSVGLSLDAAVKNTSCAK